ncbi:MAG: DUF4399 domain-containing protein [Gammaproteobacteria bacterium]|nr:DUF4399 domain-containing protein [Gammaproteobacteria bacterium]
MLLRAFLTLSLSTLLATGPAAAATPAPEGAAVYIISPEDGAEVTSPVLVRFGLKGMGVAPAGTDKEKTGHHHLLIDLDSLPDLDKPIPADANHKHFGGGQTEVSIELPAGQHSLQLLLGDLAHIPHAPPILSEKIHITVK